MSLEFKVAKMFCLPDAGSLKAFADIMVNDALLIKGLRVVEGKKGLFVTMPREQGKDSKWYDQVSCASAEIFDDIATKVLSEYQAVAV
ncbi:MAG: septation protein SpoVG family protein [Candidatus Omnitrophica bacterium]|nr:septation protein SpoVG family protein [Candidatus Omnitrophota bacterium]